MSSKLNFHQKTILDKIDRLVDEEFRNTDIPHPIYDFSVWYILLVHEDQTRFFFNGIYDEELQSMMMRIDEYKYALKNCLLRVNAEARKEKISLPVSVNSDWYNNASRFVEAGRGYEKLYRSLGSGYSGRVDVQESDYAFHISLKRAGIEAYALLEMIGHGVEPSVDILDFLYSWLREESEEALSIRREFCNVSRLRKRIITYQYSIHLLDYISRRAPQRTIIIPEGFTFPWGTAMQTQALINSLSIRCFYHLMCVNSFAYENGLRGAGVESLLLVVDKEQLREDLSLLADFDSCNIDCFIDFLTFGIGVNTPDPALQPIFATSSGKLIIPCVLFLTNDAQRNLMALYARMHRKDFDRQSYLLEVEMIEELKPYLDKYEICLINKNMSANGQREEIDVLIVDQASSSILVLEMRSMIQPGDGREVFNRMIICEEKVDQLDRKISFVKNNLPIIIKRYFPASDLDLSRIQIHGAVVLKGYGGQPSKSAEIPIVTLPILKLGLEYTSNICSLHSWLKAKDWLPQLGEHFSIEDEKLSLMRYSLYRPVLYCKTTPDKYLDYIKSTLGPDKNI